MRLVKVPLSKAVWSTWRRYCAAIGVTMGAGVARLIMHELRMAVDGSSDADVAVFERQREEELAVRESQVAEREDELAATEERTREWMKQLGVWERELQVRERRADVASRQAVQSVPASRKIGRNARCPCGSGLKHKHCHGSVERRV